MAAVMSSGAVSRSRVEPSTSASSNVTVPVGSSSLTPSSLPFNRSVSALGSVPLMLASMRRPHTAKHQHNRVDCRPRRAEFTTPSPHRSPRSDRRSRAGDNR